MRYQVLLRGDESRSHIETGFADRLSALLWAVTMISPEGPWRLFTIQEQEPAEAADHAGSA